MSLERGASRLQHIQIALSYRPIDTHLAVWPAFDRFKAEFGRERIFFDGLPAEGEADDLEEASILFAGSAPCVVAFIGAAWSGLHLLDPADVHRREIEAALINPRASLLRVLVDGATSPRAEDLPRTLRPILERPALQLETGPRYEAQLARLVRAIRMRLGA